MKKRKNLSKNHRDKISKGLKNYHKKSKTKRRSNKRKYKTDLPKESKSGHKSYKQRKKSSKPGLWANVWNKRKREGKWKG